MIGLGTLINVGLIIAGGIAGLTVGNKLAKRYQETLIIACGVATMFLGIGGALEGMLSVEEGAISSGQSMFIVIALALGALIGEFLDIDAKFERFGAWLKEKTGNARDHNFINGFVTTSLTVCIGAMAIVGAIQDGIYGDYSILATKGILDLIIVMIMTCSMGKGCVFSAIPVGILQGTVTILAKAIKPFMTTLAISNISMIGSILIFCVGLNLVFDRKIRVANLLPSIIVAVIYAFI